MYERCYSNNLIKVLTLVSGEINNRGTGEGRGCRKGVACVVKRIASAATNTTTQLPRSERTPLSHLIWLTSTGNNYNTAILHDTTHCCLIWTCVEGFSVTFITAFAEDELTLLACWLGIVSDPCQMLLHLSHSLRS